LRLFLHSTARETIIHFFRCARLFEICFVLKAAQGDSDYKPCRARENNPALCTDDSSSCPTMQREQRGIFFPDVIAQRAWRRNWCWTLMHFYRGPQTRLRPCIHLIWLCARLSLSAVLSVSAVGKLPRL
jgi:hypothetical protein